MRPGTALLRVATWQQPRTHFISPPPLTHTHTHLAPWPHPVQLVEKEVPGKFVGAVQQVIELGLRLLHEMGGKAQFYRDRLAQVGLGGRSGRRRVQGGLGAGG